MTVTTFLSRLVSGESLAGVTLRWSQTILRGLYEGGMRRSRVLPGIVCVVVVGTMPAWGKVADATASAEKVVKEAQETIEATKQYTVEQKQAFERKTQEELTTLQRQIVELREKVTHASESTRTELQQSIKELEKKKDGVRKKVEELKGATDAKWHEVREGMNTALNELKQSYRNVLSHIP